MELIIQQSHLVQTAGTFSLTVIGPHPAVFHRTSLLFKINPITQSLCPQTAQSVLKLSQKSTINTHQ